MTICYIIRFTHKSTFRSNNVIIFLMKRILITGANAQDGSYMVDYLIENTDHFILAATRRTSQPIDKHIEKYKDHPRVKFILLDLNDGHSVENAVETEKPDYFINFGASAFVPDSWNSPALTMQVNTIGVIHCLEAIKKHAPHCRFYNACSSEIFGEVLEVPQKITTRPNPRSVYGVSKNAAREIVTVYRESYGLYAVSGILFNHESPRRQNHYVTRKITKNVARIARSIRENNWDFEPLELGNLDALRDWSDAADFVVGVWKMLNQEKPKDYVLSSGEMHSVREFVEKAFLTAGISGVWSQLSNDPLTLEYIMARSGLATKKRITLVKVNPQFYRPAEVCELLGCSDEARKELGWKPKTSFDALVQKMVDWDLNNP